MADLLQPLLSTVNIFLNKKALILRGVDIMNKRGNGLISRRYIRYGFCDYDIETYKVMNCLYFVTDGEFVKIGISKLFAKRLSGLQTGSPRELRPLCVCIFDNFILAQKYEKLLHDYFFEKHVRGEWFSINESDIKSAKDKFNLTMHRCI